jgi:hypothetical protein
MKNYRDISLANVQVAIWQVFGANELLLLRNNVALMDIVAWKQNKQTAACFDYLFEKNMDSIFWVIVIARAVFTEAAVPNLTSAHHAFTLTVCDIFLNLALKEIICGEKYIK